MFGLDPIRNFTDDLLLETIQAEESVAYCTKGEWYLWPESNLRRLVPLKLKFSNF